ncbi:MAG TPA: LacI family DNA-binding transcriptional regulator [Fimbriimonas sp.]|nr:LacI family DNA-binding transcriptional regulator [Fimbriimonas sp.]
MSNRKHRDQDVQGIISRATLQSVAQRAGVSITTASVVLTGKHVSRRISADAFDRVRQAAKELNYAPNLLVRSLKRGRTHILSFYNGFRNREPSDLYMDKLSTAIEYAGGKRGYDILVQCNYERQPQETYEFLNGGFADGVLMFAPDTDDQLFHLLRRSSLPVVLINARDPEGVLPSIADDNETGMRLLADTLASLGHRRIAAIRSTGATVRDAETRIRFFAERLEQNGIDPPLIVEEQKGLKIESVVAELMAWPEPPTALFCWHDRLAYRVLDACSRLGISVPDSLSVIGYDGLHWPSRTSHTAASVRVDLDLLAEMAVKILDLYITGYSGPLVEEILPISLSPGTTLAPVSQKSEVTA